MQFDGQHVFFDPQLLTNITKFRNSDVINTLEGTNLHKVADTWGSTLLHFATKHGNQSIIEHLINIGANVNAQDQYGSTPLMYIPKGDKFWTIKILLEAGADIYLRNCKGRCALETILHDKTEDYADKIKLFFEVVQKDCATVEEIVQVMSSVDCPIYHAVLWKNSKITKSRVDDGCCVNARNPNDEKTALHVAVRLGDSENVKYLLENGAQVNAEDWQRRTPLSYLNPTDCSHGNLEILRLLIARGAILYNCYANNRMQMYNILKKGVPKVVRVLLEHDIRFFKEDEYRDTPVHYLAKNENDGSIDELQGKNFDPNFHDESFTPLQVAAAAGLVGNVKFLLDNDADVNGIDNFRLTPLFHAVRSKSSEKSLIKAKGQCVELLLERGADAMHEGEGQDTVFDIIRPFETYALAKPILLHLVVKEVLGTSVTKVILEKIDSHPYFKKHFEMYRRQMKIMQKSTVCESVTLFKFLAESDQKIEGYARNRKVVKRLKRLSTKCTLRNHCKSYLKKRVMKAIRMAQVKQRAAVAVGSIVKLGGDVVERIAGYLSEREVKNLLDVRK